MTRASVIQQIEQYFDQNHFFSDLSRRVSIPTESQIPERSAELHRYLQDEIAAELADMGFTFTIEKNPIAGGGPVLIAYREEGPAFTTVLTYGHGDVVRGYDDQWRRDLSPWVLTQDGDRWFGRGSADNKGQHTINLAALRYVLACRGYLGFNIKVLIETGEEVGSVGLAQFAVHLMQ